MKTILGLDLGAASIGWAVIQENDTYTQILNLGSRVIPYEGTEGKDFSKGTGESRNALRTKARTVRKGYDRYQQRRKFLIDILIKNDMMPAEELRKMPKMELWELRSKAVTQDITKQELGRLLLWLNQKRGYKSGRMDASQNKKDAEYVAQVKNRHQLLKEKGFTIGQYFFEQLRIDPYFRVKDNVFPREAYMEEFDAICKRQSALLSEELTKKIRDEIIYHQRPLKSQKGLVSVCEFERKWVEKEGKKYFAGPKVAPKSSPLFQIEKIWENIHTIKITDKKGESLVITPEQKQKIFRYLDDHEKMTSSELFKILGISKKEYVVNKQIEKGIQGNLTKTAIQKCLGSGTDFSGLLQLHLKVIHTEARCYLYDRETGEILNEKDCKMIDPAVEKEPLFQLWHTIYSINDVDECIKALINKFHVDHETATKLAHIDFTKSGFGNKSVRLIRKILPYLMEGDNYSEAMSYAGHNHSFSLTAHENISRQLQHTLNQLPKNSLRQPIVEKILNQMINLVNTIIEQYSRKDELGNIMEYFKFDEIRIELARELKQSKEERNRTEKEITKRERENEIIKKRLSEYGLRATRNNILKWRLYEEINDHDKKLNAICIYCGQPISLTDAILGREVEVEHIIPKVKLFDDSQSNKTLAHKRCNSTKKDLTAYDFMSAKPAHVFEEYIERVNLLYANKVISKSKRDKLLMSKEDIPDNFIERQLRESQYIAKKAREILQTICYNVWSTTGTVTAELRRIWGWEDITMRLQLPKYREHQLTEMETWTSNHGKSSHSKEKIIGWTKRDDHRHHAVDALTIACTKQGFIQRLNTLNSIKTQEDIYKTIEDCTLEFREKLSKLEKYIKINQPIAVAEVEKAVAGILISFKPGKKVAVKGKRKFGKRGHRKVVQTGIIVPRGALSEESVYGKIRIVDEKKNIKYLFENPDLIVDPKVKQLVEERLTVFQNDRKKAVASLKKDPIYLNEDRSLLLEEARCYKEEYVIKYAVDINFNKIDKVIDGRVKRILKNRLDKFGGKPKEAFKEVQQGDRVIPWYVDDGLERPIRSVRCSTGLSAVVPVRKDRNNKEIGFVKPGNNHHIAIYSDQEQNKWAYGCTFWHAVERKKFGIPVVIKNTNEVWDRILAADEETYPIHFLEKLPPSNQELIVSMQQNEMFILGLTGEDIKLAMGSDNYKLISDHLYRVQKIAIAANNKTIDIFLRHHLETQI
ncbi:MAG: type II CRISPR RNA-guided endonuclease Cas9, partial [Bacteroides sp.]|nr:type II CRISPR RNA-guided endonuclease Cas9 [Bacteroides sp.]